MKIISIRSPMKGETLIEENDLQKWDISIRSPMKGETSKTRDRLRG